MIAESILAIMLQLATPGQSIYSLTEVAQDAGPACADRMSLLCTAPKYNAHHSSWVRPETWGEGLARYWTIAKTLESVAQSDALQAIVLTAIYHESGMRKDVMSGIGGWARGDRGKSWCLGQILLGASGNTKVTEGWAARELVGIDPESTRKCLTVTTRYASASLSACHGMAADGACVFSFYAGGNRARTDKRLVERARTLARVRELGHPVLPLEAKVELGL